MATVFLGDLTWFRAQASPFRAGSSGHWPVSRNTYDGRHRPRRQATHENQTGRTGAAPVVAPCPNASGVDADGRGWTSGGGNHRRVPHGPSAVPTGNQSQPRSCVSTPPTWVGGVRSMARPVSAPSKGRDRTHPFGRSPQYRSGDRAGVEPQAGESAQRRTGAVTRPPPDVALTNPVLPPRRKLLPG